MTVEPPADRPTENSLPEQNFGAERQSANKPVASSFERTSVQPVASIDPVSPVENTGMEWMRLRAALQNMRSTSQNRSVASLNAAARQLEPDFAAVLPHGTSVVMDLRTFEFVHAATRSAALMVFIARFGRDAHGWAFEIGVPMNAGGGICAS